MNEPTNTKITFKSITVQKENFLQIINPDTQVNEHDGILYYNTGIYGSRLDNAFPNLLLDLYTNATSVHSNFINLKGTLILGNNLQAEDDTQASIVDPFLMTYNKSGDNLKSVYAKSTMDMSLFEGVVLQCVFNREGKVAEVYHIPTQNFRLAKQNKYGYSDFGYISQNFGYISNSFSTSKLNQLAGAVKIKMWQPDVWKKYPVQLMYLKPYSYSPYSIPSYSSGLNWILIAHEISEFHKNNLKTNMFLSGILTQLKGSMSDEMMEANSDEIEKFYSGGKGRKVLLAYVDDMAGKPTFDSIAGIEQDQVFIELHKESFQQVVTAHNGFPILAGVDPKGASLGGDANMINIALQAFTHLVTDKKKQVILDGINRIMLLNELPPVTCITEPLKITQPLPQPDDLTRNERRSFLYDLPEIDESQNNVSNPNSMPS
jgi:hypothetical protein